MISHVHNSDNCWDFFADYDFNSLFQRDIYHPATVAPSSESDDGLVIINTKELDSSSVSGYHWTNITADDFSDGFGDIIHPHWVRIFKLKSTSHQRLYEI